MSSSFDLKYWKDGVEVVCGAIDSNGRVGQTVVFDHVNYGENPDFEKYPLAAYPLGTLFTIVERHENKSPNGPRCDFATYTLEDQHGRKIELDKGKEYGSTNAYLYDGTAWLTYRIGSNNDHLKRKDGRIQYLEGVIALLKSILTDCTRVVTTEEAKKMGITPKA